MSAKLVPLTSIEQAVQIYGETLQLPYLNNGRHETIKIREAYNSGRLKHYVRTGSGQTRGIHGWGVETHGDYGRMTDLEKLIDDNFGRQEQEKTNALGWLGIFTDNRWKTRNENQTLEDNEEEQRRTAQAQVDSLAEQINQQQQAAQQEQEQQRVQNLNNQLKNFDENYQKDVVDKSKRRNRNVSQVSVRDEIKKRFAESGNPITDEMAAYYAASFNEPGMRSFIDDGAISQQDAFQASQWYNFGYDFKYGDTLNGQAWQSSDGTYQEFQQKKNAAREQFDNENRARLKAQAAEKNPLITSAEEKQRREILSKPVDFTKQPQQRVAVADDRAATQQGEQQSRNRVQNSQTYIA
jgi:hypothetical protein